ncbi:hypothetical protein N8T08_006028 [Aspergillus melleus]|uniref:Uncharacterized protein n=1 Tax=Aspergillus melleus TaxID=138277 RepID=A0ACC3B1G7_9EURO|nr:hypothetical protein N8T08_006028 [Aspergillus melleus]
MTDNNTYVDIVCENYNIPTSVDINNDKAVIEAILALISEADDYHARPNSVEVGTPVEVALSVLDPSQPDMSVEEVKGLLVENLEQLVSTPNFPLPYYAEGSEKSMLMVSLKYW